MKYSLSFQKNLVFSYQGVNGSNTQVNATSPGTTFDVQLTQCRLQINN